MFRSRVRGGVVKPPLAWGVPATLAIHEYRVSGCSPRSTPPETSTGVPSSETAVSATALDARTLHRSAASDSLTRSRYGPRVNAPPAGPSRYESQYQTVAPNSSTQTPTKSPSAPRAKRARVRRRSRNSSPEERASCSCSCWAGSTTPGRVTPRRAAAYRVRPGLPMEPAGANRSEEPDEQQDDDDQSEETAANTHAVKSPPR